MAILFKVIIRPNTFFTISVKMSYARTDQGRRRVISVPGIVHAHLTRFNAFQRAVALHPQFVGAGVQAVIHNVDLRTLYALAVAASPHPGRRARLSDRLPIPNTRYWAHCTRRNYYHVFVILVCPRMATITSLMLTNIGG